MVFPVISRSVCGCGESFTQEGIETFGLPSATFWPSSERVTDVQEKRRHSVKKKDSEFNNLRNEKKQVEWEHGLKEAVGERIPYSATAGLLTSKSDADRSLDGNVLVQIMSIGENLSCNTTKRHWGRCVWDVYRFENSHSWHVGWFEANVLFGICV